MRMKESWKKKMRMKEAWKKKRIMCFPSRQREAMELLKTIRIHKVSRKEERKE